jgi:hypothetical protein
MELQLKISLLNAIEYIEELTTYDFDYVAKEILGVGDALLKELKSFKE